ncbi:hypothetical protein Dimus_014231, partial [Dionaea muscipula]
MDFGLVGIDGFVGQGQDSGVPGFGQEPKTKSSGSGLAKKERSIGDSGPVEVVDCRASKVSRGAADGLVLYKTLPVHHQGNPGLRSTSSQPQMQMLSFSSPKQEVSFLSEESGRAGVVAGAGACGFGDKSAQNMPLSYYQYTTPSAYTRNS